MPHLSAATNEVQWAHVGPVYAAQPGGRGEGRGREPTWGAAAPSRIQRPAHQPSLDCQWHVLSLRREYSGQSNPRPRLRRSHWQSSSTVPRTRHAIRPAPPSLRLLGSDAASGTAARQRAAGCSMCRPLRHSALGCNTVHVVATQCVLLRHTCVAQRQMSRRAAVVTPMWAWAWTWLRCRCGLGWTLSQC